MHSTPEQDQTDRQTDSEAGRNVPLAAPNSPVCQELFRTFRKSFFSCQAMKLAEQRAEEEENKSQLDQANKIPCTSGSTNIAYICTLFDLDWQGFAIILYLTLVTFFYWPSCIPPRSLSLQSHVVRRYPQAGWLWNLRIRQPNILISLWAGSKNVSPSLIMSQSPSPKTFRNSPPLPRSPPLFFKFTWTVKPLKVKQRIV